MLLSRVCQIRAVACADFPGVLNGDFATYTGADNTDYFELTAGSTDLTGWTIAAKVMRVKSGFIAQGSPMAISGSWFISLEGTGGGSISTTLTGMQIGSEYTVTWYERSRTDLQPRELVVKTGDCSSGVDVSALHIVPATWGQISRSFVASAASEVLCFTTSGGSAEGSVFLDGITAVKSGDDGIYWSAASVCID